MWFLFVLSLSCTVLEIDSQSVPYISFMGNSLPNHSYVDLSQVGSDPSDSIQCHTDLKTCCSDGQGNHRGDWYFPDGTRLPFPGGGGIYQLLSSQRVALRRTSPNSPSGIYRCDIPTVDVHNENDISLRDTVYVGVYASGGKYSHSYSL